MAKPGTEHKCAQCHLNDLAAAPSMPADAAATHVPRAMLFRLPHEACLGYYTCSCKHPPPPNKDARLPNVRFGCRISAQMPERETAGFTSSEWQGDCTLQQVNSRRFKASIKNADQCQASGLANLLCLSTPHATLSCSECCLLGSLRKAHEVNALESSLPIQLNCMASD